MSDRPYGGQSDHDILGVGPRATPRELKRAYRQKALEVHPDRNTSDPKAHEKFLRVQEAYNRLSEQCDSGAQGSRDSSPWATPTRARQTSSEPSRPGHRESTDPQDLFSSIGDRFEQVRAQSADWTQPCELDIVASESVSFDEMLSGTQCTIDIKRQSPCDACGGRGAPSEEDVDPCGACQGQGHASYREGFFEVHSICRACEGRGHHLSTHCPSCYGSGTAWEETSLDIDIPVGIDDQESIRIPDVGHWHPSRSRGDLWVRVHVEDHERFDRENLDLYVEIEVPFDHLLLERDVQVPTPDSHAPLVFQPNIADVLPGGNVFVWDDQGIQTSNGSGDLVFQIIPTFPDSLSKRQQSLLEQFRTESSDGDDPEE